MSEWVKEWVKEWKSEWVKEWSTYILTSAISSQKSFSSSNFFRFLSSTDMLNKKGWCCARINGTTTQYKAIHYTTRHGRAGDRQGVRRSDQIRSDQIRPNQQDRAGQDLARLTQMKILAKSDQLIVPRTTRATTTQQQHQTTSSRQATLYWSTSNATPGQTLLLIPTWSVAV